MKIIFAKPSCNRGRPVWVSLLIGGWIWLSVEGLASSGIINFDPVEEDQLNDVGGNQLRRIVKGQRSMAVVNERSLTTTRRYRRKRHRVPARADTNINSRQGCRCEYPNEGIYTSTGSRTFGAKESRAKSQPKLKTASPNVAADSNSYTIINGLTILPPTFVACLGVVFVCPDTTFDGPIWNYDCTGAGTTDFSGYVVVLPANYFLCLCRTAPTSFDTGATNSPTATGDSGALKSAKSKKRAGGIFSFTDGSRKLESELRFDNSRNLKKGRKSAPKTGSTASPTIVTRFVPPFRCPAPVTSPDIASVAPTTVATTFSPTISPAPSTSTGEPTSQVVEFTGFPTVFPTENTGYPTEGPTTLVVAFTFPPTAKPTPVPTLQPTRTLTRPPTSPKPTSAPTPPPTPQPTTTFTLPPITANPTPGPTPPPTPQPTTTLTLPPFTPNPTPAPTPKPTKGPSSSPTQTPTVQPTAAVFAAPTFFPSEKPTPSPTVRYVRPGEGVPDRPDYNITGNLTFSPTPQLTAYPTLNPTTSPTARVIPVTSDPSGTPSTYPTYTPPPTNNPTTTLTRSPTTQPTARVIPVTSPPTKLPTSLPNTPGPTTELPTPSPTPRPQVVTEIPTLVPSLAPSKGTSAAPTKLATARPTSAPSDEDLPTATWYPTVDYSAINERITCIAVVDDAHATAEELSGNWTKFRNDYPQRPFCLLQPGPNDKSELKIPAAFENDPNTTYVQFDRDYGVAENASDWFELCGLGQLQREGITRVALAIDTPQLYVANYVRAAYESFLIKIAAVRVSLVQVRVDGDENWVSPFFQDFC